MFHVEQFSMLDRERISLGFGLNTEQSAELIQLGPLMISAPS